MTGFGVLLGLWIISISIDRMTDKLCDLLKQIQINFGSIKIVRDEPGEEGK